MAWDATSPSHATPSALARDAALAVAVTLIGAVLAWALAGGLPLVGIDDAAITRSYAENLAAGHGYVYYVGGEPVEGATSLLWTVTLALVYRVTTEPEVMIVALTGALAALATLSALRLGRHLAGRMRLREDLVVGGLAIGLIASPAYYAWAIWTMMEVALWSALLLWLTLVLARLVEGDDDRWTRPAIVAAAALLPLVRPEGFAMAAGLIALATLLAPSAWRTGLVGVGVGAASFAAVTAWRLASFGQPFPNTFYAKVSSDAAQGLRDGLNYLADFALGSPFVDVLILIWAGATVWALSGLRGPRPDGAGGLLIAAALVFGTLAVYATLGGDHFALWRFYQPIAPVLLLAAVLGLAVAFSTLRLRGKAGLVLSGALAVAVSTGWLHYREARLDIRREFTLVERGVAFGTHLNDIEPLPVIGVGPAGGIALAYEGPILDLLGLNWPEMAHANPLKEGARNHASFHKPTFWRHAPDVVAAFERRCPEGDGLLFWTSTLAAFDGLHSDERFREAYRPVRFEDAENCWPGFATPQWLARAEGAGVRRVDWSDVVMLD